MSGEESRRFLLLLTCIENRRHETEEEEMDMREACMSQHISKRSRMEKLEKETEGGVG